MLVLSRKTGEGIVCHLPGGETIRFVITLIRGAQVRVGIEAPQEVAIVRDNARRIRLRKENAHESAKL